MSEKYIRNAVAQIQERRPVAAATVAPGRVSGVSIGQDGTMINTLDRNIQNVPEPATFNPPNAHLFEPGQGLPNVPFLKQHFSREGRLTEEQALTILQRTTDLLGTEPNLVQVKSPVTICGDIHGQYYDLMKLFDVGGTFDENNYLFLGDYVDRGNFGIECLLYLYALKLRYPSKLVLLRGNHECRHLTEYFTFKRECLHKYSSRVYDACIRSFCALPIAAVVDSRFFCVHGGLSPELIRLSDLDHINRFQEPGSFGLLCDLLWSDPIPSYGHEHEPSQHGPPVPPGTQFLPNVQRGCSYTFTYEAACKFLERNGLLGIIRGHEAQDAGYTMHRKTPTKKFPSVITIFSAPNYLDVYRNRGAVLKYANKNITIRQYNYTSHPYWLPNFMDAFTWSLPFVGAKITEMLLAILRICTEEELLESDGDSEAATKASDAEIQKRRQAIKNKILAVGKMQRAFQKLREDSEKASELMITPEDDVHGIHGEPGDALGVQGYQIGRSVRSFDTARRMDMQNERLPQFNPEMLSQPRFPAPSMRFQQQNGIDSQVTPSSV
ncbi:hypothetical protein AX14_003683 [Amanita brunnescens Koide BX004]|nr:hypothetical protein AX14_003683 [Amanita brunnescens Koide BX004]